MNLNLLGVASICAVGIALAISGCGSDAFNGMNSASLGASSSSAGGSVFQPGGAGGPGNGSTTQPASGPGRGSTNQPIGGGSSSPSGAPTCTGPNSADLSALTAAVKAANAGGPLLAGPSCQATLLSFSASATDSAGNVKNLSSGDTSSDISQIGVNCTPTLESDNTTNVALFCLDCADGSLGGISPSTQKAIMTTNLCGAGSAAPCTPASSGFILQIQYTGGKDSNGNAAVKEILLPNGTLVTAADMACDGGTFVEADPLLIEDSPGKAIVTLDPHSTNTYFDLMGDGAQSRISCVKNGSYLVLPDQNGQVLNINQLFGNNTVGPDGKKAPNGFIALGKYDENGDGVIDARDSVYSQLRLWSDVNCDGVAQANELSLLSLHNISGIKWAGMVLMHEVDQWGNVTEGRNRVFLDPIGISVVFDLWFKIAE